MKCLLLRRLAALSFAFALAGAPLGALAASHGGHQHEGHQHEGHEGKSSHMTQDDQGKTAEGVYTTTGVVKSVDEAAGKASIAHEPVPSLKWPAMTMTFTESSKGMLKGIKAGDKVRIDFKQKGDTTLIMDIETVK